MAKLFFSCHGKMASGMKSSLEILVGDVSNLEVFDAYINDEDINVFVKKFFEKNDDGEMKVLISDLYGGSVNQVLFQYINRPNTYLITGINLPLLLEIVSATNCNLLTPSSLKNMLQEARNTIKIISDEIECNEELDFF